MTLDEAPLVTAVIPVYNHQKYVTESIRSILRQSYTNIELIVINDGSTDGSHEVISTLIEECKQRCRRFEYINRNNAGLATTLNQALSIARGKYFSTLASDDIAMPEKFSLLIEALESADDIYAAAFGNALFIDDHSNRIWLSENGAVSKTRTATSYDNYLDFRTGGGEDIDYRSNDFCSYSSFLSHNSLPAMSIVVKTDLIRRVGAWTAGNTSEDWELWRKLSKLYKFLYIDSALALYRWHENNTVKVMSDKLKLDDLLNLRKEKQYCASKGLIRIWRNEYAVRLLPVLADKRIPLGRKLSSLDLSAILRPSFYWYSARRLGCKVLRAVTRQK